jgi:hypothetical protein
MKQISLIRLIVFTVSSLFFSGVYSQLSSNSSSPDIAIRPSAAKVTAAGVDADKMALASMKSVNARMFAHFQKNFRNASNIIVRPEADFTHISFKENGVSNKVQYSKKGKWMYSLRTYDESRLPDNIRSEVETSFPGYRVFGFVNEVDVLNKTATLVMIENRDSWKRIRLLDDQIEVYEEYRKSK